MEERIINIENVSKKFSLGETPVQALHEVSFDIHKGGMTALMGPSGSGKSTLLNLIGALDAPSAGSITINGKKLEKMSSNQRAEFRNETVGFIFQNFNLIPVLTALENVLLPNQLSRSALSAQEANKRAKLLLNKVGLADQMHQSANRLSGGQMQRVAIARALMNQPQLILADEPTANLDHNTAESILTVLEDLCESEKATIIIATHDHAVLRFCRRIISLRDGKMTGDELKLTPFSVLTQTKNNVF